MCHPKFVERPLSQCQHGLCLLPGAVVRLVCLPLGWTFGELLPDMPIWFVLYLYRWFYYCWSPLRVLLFVISHVVFLAGPGLTWHCMPSSILLPSVISFSIRIFWLSQRLPPVLLWVVLSICHNGLLVSLREDNLALPPWFVLLLLPCPLINDWLCILTGLELHVDGALLLLSILLLIICKPFQYNTLYIAWVSVGIHGTFPAWNFLHCHSAAARTSTYCLSTVLYCSDWWAVNADTPVS